MICITECSPAKAPDGRTHVIDAATASEYRAFKHAFVPGEDAADYTVPSSSSSSSSSSQQKKSAQQQQQQQLVTYNSTAAFLPIGAGTVLLSQEQQVIHNCSLAQSHPVSRCVTPERITAAVASPCGRFLGVGGETGTVYFFSAATGEMMWLRKGHVRGVSCIAFSSDSSLLCSASHDTTCRTVRIGTANSDSGSGGGGAGGGFSGGAVVMTGHTLAVTACSFTKFVHRVVSVSKDRTCRLSDPLSGAVLRVFTAPLSLTSVCVGPSDSVFACGATNGAIVFFAAPATNNTSSSSSSSASASASTLFSQGASDSFTDNEECRVVGPFSGGPQAPIFFMSRIFGAFESSTASAMTAATTTTAASSAEAAKASSSSSTAAATAGTDALICVSRDGFCQLFSWATGAFIRDLVHYKRGAMAACVIPGPLSASPQWSRYAMTTISDRTLIQRSAVPFKKAPVSAAGARVFLVRQIPSAVLASESVSTAAAAAGRRDRSDDSECRAAVEAHAAGLLSRIELEALKVTQQQLLAEANRLYAEVNDGEEE